MALISRTGGGSSSSNERTNDEEGTCIGGQVDWGTNMRVFILCDITWHTCDDDGPLPLPHCIRPERLQGFCDSPATGNEYLSTGRVKWGWGRRKEAKWSPGLDYIPSTYCSPLPMPPVDGGGAVMPSIGSEILHWNGRDNWKEGAQEWMSVWEWEWVDDEVTMKNSFMRWFS